MIPFVPRAYLALGVAAALAVGGIWVYGKGYAAGGAKIQAEWDQDRAIRERLHLEALRRSQDLLDEARRITHETEQNLTARLAAADARGRDLARRLRDALAAPGTCPLPPVGGTPGPADGAGGKPADPAEVGEALADHLAACERDAQRLTDLQGWVGRIQREVVIPDLR